MKYQIRCQVYISQKTKTIRNKDKRINKKKRTKEIKAEQPPPPLGLVAQLATRPPHDPTGQAGPPRPPLPHIPHDPNPNPTPSPTRPLPPVALPPPPRSRSDRGERPPRRHRPDARRRPRRPPPTGAPPPHRPTTPIPSPLSPARTTPPGPRLRLDLSVAETPLAATPSRRLAALVPDDPNTAPSSSSFPSPLPRTLRRPCELPPPLFLALTPWPPPRGSADAAVASPRPACPAPIGARPARPTALRCCCRLSPLGLRAAVDARRRFTAAA